eukprot:scaffold5184_cov121-Isochrysis_galbana.AAC.4
MALTLPGVGFRGWKLGLSGAMRFNSSTVPSILRTVATTSELSAVELDSNTVFGMRTTPSTATSRLLHRDPLSVDGPWAFWTTGRFDRRAPYGSTCHVRRSRSAAGGRPSSENKKAVSQDLSRNFDKTPHCKSTCRFNRRLTQL